jgi:uncharacterized coiled-coil protein SlyX
VNVRDCLLWHEERAKTQSRPTGDTPDVEIRRRKDIAEMERAERQNALESGEIARIDTTCAEWSEQVAQIAARLDALPSRFGSTVASAIGQLLDSTSPESMDELRLTVEVTLTELCDELRDELAAMADDLEDDSASDTESEMEGTK